MFILKDYFEYFYLSKYFPFVNNLLDVLSFHILFVYLPYY